MTPSTVPTPSLFPKFLFHTNSLIIVLSSEATIRCSRSPFLSISDVWLSSPFQQMGKF